MWSAYLFHVASGQIGPQLNFSTAQWSVSLNATEAFSFEVRKSDLPRIDLNEWLTPWRYGVVYMWNRTPIVAGPIISRPMETFKTVSIEGQGIRAILARRLAVAEQSDWSQLPKTSLTYTAMSLGTIAQRVISQVQLKPGGSLPITFPIPEEFTADDTYHSRTYNGFDVQNINVDKILTDLSNVANGPDFMFKPRLVTANQLTFDFWHGTEGNPRINQTRGPVWDTTPIKGAVSSMGVVMTGTYETSRVYSVGAGSDQGLLLQTSTNYTPLVGGTPLLETTINMGNSDIPDVVLQHGIGNLSYNSEMIQEIQMTVQGDDEVNGLGMFWPGDLVDLVVNGWISIKDGTVPARLLNMNGDATSSVKLSLQPEDKYEANEILLQN